MNGKENSNDLAGHEVRRRTGGRTARVVAAIHAATLELLEERGYEQMEIPEIAERAQVYKTTIYRRWPNKMELVLDVALTRLETTVPIPDTGNLLEDLMSLLSLITIMLATPFTKGLLRALMTAKELNENLQEAQTTFWNTRFEVAKVIVERAIERGELPVGVNSRHFIEFAAAPLFYRALVTGDTISDDDIRRIAQQTYKAFK